MTEVFKSIAKPVAKPAIKKPFILDTFNPDDVLFSFSIARALSSFSSPFQIRRGSDSAVLNVGYPGGVIDEQAIKNFGGKNLWSYTNDFSNSVWIKHSGAFVTQTNNIAPTGENSWEINFTNGVFIFQFVKQNISSVQNVVFSAYVRGVTGESINISITNSTNTISNPHTFNGDWQRVNITADFQTDLNGNIDSLRGAVGRRSLASGFFEAASWQFEIESTPTSYQSRSAGGASDCFVASYQNVGDEQPKIYDASTGEVTKENGKPAMVFDGVNDNVEIPNVAGNSVIDAYFVNRHNDTSTTAIDNEVYLYPTGNGAGNFGFVGVKNSTSVDLNSSSYGSPSLYKNNLELFPANRSEVYSLLGQTQNIVNHQGATTSNWTEYKYGRYDSGGGIFHFEGTLQEIIIFKRVLSNDERNRLHDDIMDFYKISN